MTAHVANFSMNINDVFAPLYIAVATGAATCQTNTDPKTGSWASRTMPVSTSWIDVAYGAGIIVAISGAASNTYAATTVNGTTWIQRTLPVASTWASLIYGNNKFVAISGTGNHIAYSPDGCSWTYDTISGTNRQWISIAYGNGTYCAIAYSTTADTLYTSVSTDGTTWNNNTATNITCTGQWNKIIYGNGRFVAVCKDSSVSAYSTDGINWTASALPSSTAWKSVCYGNGIYIAVTETNSDKAAKSTDNAATWSEITLPVASTWRTVIFGKNLINENVFTCIGATTVSNYSIDNGVTWYAKTQITMTYTAACYAPVTWYSGDSLTIANTGKIDVTTDQNRFWSSIAISKRKSSICQVCELSRTYLKLDNRVFVI